MKLSIKGDCLENKVLLLPWSLFKSWDLQAKLSLTYVWKEYINIFMSNMLFSTLGNNHLICLCKGMSVETTYLREVILYGFNICTSFTDLSPARTAFCAMYRNIHLYPCNIQGKSFWHTELLIKRNDQLETAL